MSDAFISYARIDIAFVEKLRDALSQQKFDVWVDLEAIAPTTKWLDEILSGIDAADAFVYVLSPESAISDICAVELARAVERNKRLVPLLYRAVAPGSANPTLREVQWIDCRSPEQFEPAVCALATALNTDPESAHTHTRLPMRALEWERDRKAKSVLLRGASLQAAERWLTDRGPDDLPKPTSLHRDFIGDSRRAATLRRRLGVGVLTATVLVLALLAVIAYSQRNQAALSSADARGQRAVAQQQSDLARARQLAAAAIAELPRDPELCVLLGLEAARLAPSGAEMLNALRQCVPEARVIVSLQNLPTGDFSRAVFSPDGQMVLVPAADGTVYVRRASGEALLQLSGQIDSSNHAAFSADGAQIVTAGDRNTVRVYETKTGHLMVTLRGHTKEINDVRFSPDGARVASTGWDNTTRVWNVQQGRAIAQFPSYAIAGASFSPDGLYLIAANGPTAGVWNAVDGHHVANLQGHQGNITATAFSPDGRFVVTTSVDDTGRIWEVPSGKLRAVLRGHTEFVRNVAISADARVVATGSDDGTARLWDSGTGRMLANLAGHRGSVKSVAFSPDTKWLLTASADSTARVWLVRTGEMTAELRGHTGAVVDAAYSADGSRAITRSIDQTARIWDASPRGQISAIPTRSNNSAYPAVVSPDGTVVVVGGADGVGRIFDVSRGRPAVTLSTDVWRPTFSKDGRQMASISSDPQSWRNPSHIVARVWEIPTGKELAILRAQGAAGQVAAISPDGRWVVVCSIGAKLAHVWDARTGELVAVLRGAQSDNAAPFSPDSSKVVMPDATGASVWQVPEGKVLAELRTPAARIFRAWFSPDGRRVFTTSSDGIARIWDVGTSKVVAEFQGHQNILDAAFSPAGDRIATMSADTTSRVWNAQTGEAVAELIGHTSDVLRGAFSPDGRWIVTASRDNSARIWDAATGAPVAVVTGHKGSVTDAVFTADAKHVVSASGDRAQVFLCGACVGDLVSLARSRVSRSLTRSERQKYLGESLQ